MGKINRSKHGRGHSSCVSHPLPPPPNFRPHVFTLLQVGISTTEKLASYPGLHAGGGRRPGTHCLRMRVI